MKQIKRLKSLLQRCVSVRVYKMADRADGEAQCMFYFVISRNINSLHICLRLLCRLLHCKPLSKYAARP